MTFHQNHLQRLNGSNMSEKKLIYVSYTTYVHPNTDGWQPVQAIHEHKNCYRVLEESDDPEHDYWQFSLGDIVECKNNKFAEGEFGLIAIKKCAHDLSKEN